MVADNNVCGYTGYDTWRFFNKIEGAITNYKSSSVHVSKLNDRTLNINLYISTLWKNKAPVGGPYTYVHMYIRICRLLDPQILLQNLRSMYFCLLRRKSFDSRLDSLCRFKFDGFSDWRGALNANHFRIQPFPFPLLNTYTSTFPNWEILWHSPCFSWNTTFLLNSILIWKFSSWLDPIEWKQPYWEKTLKFTVNFFI